MTIRTVTVYRPGQPSHVWTGKPGNDGLGFHHDQTSGQLTIVQGRRNEVLGVYVHGGWDGVAAGGDDIDMVEVEQPRPGPTSRETLIDLLRDALHTVRSEDMELGEDISDILEAEKSGPYVNRVLSPDEAAALRDPEGPPGQWQRYHDPDGQPWRAGETRTVRGGGPTTTDG
jgi:hypothetical protein